MGVDKESAIVKKIRLIRKQTLTIYLPGGQGTAKTTWFKTENTLKKFSFEKAVPGQVESDTVI